MVTGEQAIQIASEMLAGKPVSVEGRDSEEFQRQFRQDMDLAKRNGWTIELPSEIPVDADPDDGDDEGWEPVKNCGGTGGKPGPCPHGSDVAYGIKNYWADGSKDPDRAAELTRQVKSLSDSEVVRAVRKIGAGKRMPWLGRARWARERLLELIGNVGEE